MSNVIKTETRCPRCNEAREVEVRALPTTQPATRSELSPALAKSVP